MMLENPGLLWLFLFYILIIPVIIIRYRKSRERASLFAAAAPSGDRKQFLRKLRQRIIISEIMFILFTGLLIIALSGPRWGTRIVPDHRRGVDLVLAFDVSASMNVRDEIDSVSRLERGRELALELTAGLGDIRLGAVIGRGRGILAVPLTFDTGTVLGFLHGLTSESISGGGTNLESLVDSAILAFNDSVPSRRGIIIFSDGEALSGSLQSAFERARRAGIFVTAIGLGSDQGGRVPVSSAAAETYLVGTDGLEVISQRQTNLLRSGAERTGGIYVDGSRMDAVQVLLDHINSLSSESMIFGFRREDNPRRHLFILTAIFCFALMRLMGFSRRSRSQVKKILPVLFCIFLFNSCDSVQGKLLVMEGNFLTVRGYYSEAISSYLRALEFEDTAPYAEYGLGSIYISLSEGEAALERYSAAESILSGLNMEDHRELYFRIQYNRGILFFEMEDYDEAANAFREALRIDSSRIEAKQNLELSLLSTARRSSIQAPMPQDEIEIDGDSTSGISAIVFEYLREKESEQWRSREWDGESDYTGLDY